MKHIFILNPAAGSGYAEKVLQPQIITYLKTTDLDYEIHRSLNKEEIGSYGATVSNVSYAGSGSYVTSYSVSLLIDPIPGAYPGMSASAEITVSPGEFGPGRGTFKSLHRGIIGFFDLS